MSNQETKTEVEVGEYKGNEVLTIWELDDEGRRLKFPLLSFGKKKAEAILKNLDVIQKFIEGSLK